MVQSGVQSANLLFTLANVLVQLVSLALELLALLSGFDNVVSLRVSFVSLRTSDNLTLHRVINDSVSACVHAAQREHLKSGFQSLHVGLSVAQLHHDTVLIFL